MIEKTCNNCKASWRVEVVKEGTQGSAVDYCPVCGQEGQDSSDDIGEGTLDA
jgi:uncharacterized Zn finger protein (UPF0148 family)